MVKAFLWSTAMFLVLFGLAVAGLAWGVTTYVGIARQQVALDRDWSEVEDAYVHRLDLVPDMLVGLERVRGVDRSARERLAEARLRAERVIPTPELLDSPEELAEFLALQDELSVRLEPVLAEARNAAESGPMAVLVEHLSEAQARIDAKRPELGSAVERFNLCLTGFPNAWIADLLGVRPIRAGATTRAEG